MLKKLSLNIVLLVITLPLLGIFAYISFCQPFGLCIQVNDGSIKAPSTAIAKTQTATSQEATAQAATAIAQKATATAQKGTAIAQDGIAVAATKSATAQAATATAQAATATAQAATATAIPVTQTAIAQKVSASSTISGDGQSPTIKAIFERGYLIAGVTCDFSPMGYIQDQLGYPVECTNRDYENHERAGFEVEIIKEFAKRWLGDESAVEFKTVKDPNDNIMKITKGEVDLGAAAMTHKKNRDEKIGFSQTHFLDEQDLLVLNDSQIKSVEDLHGKSVAVVPNTTSIENLRAEEKRLGITIDIIEIKNHNVGVEQLKEGQVDAYTTDGVRLLQLSQQDDDFRLVKEPFSKEPYGIGVPKGDAEFRDLVNFTLQEMKLDGTYDLIYGKWFGDDPSFIYDLETLPGTSYLNVNLIPMQRIEAGKFTLGIQGSEVNPERTVSLEAFSIDQYEVTNRLYKQCVDDGKCEVPQDLEQYANPDYAKHPVTWVTLEQAKTYCAYVGKELPTENQWEAAARGDDERVYPWGNEVPNDKRANFNQFNPSTLEVIWDPNISAHENHVSPYGLHHMAGNVREWVKPPPHREEVTRGGGWKDTDIKTTTRFRFAEPADDVGFRCAVWADEFPSPLP